MSCFKEIFTMLICIEGMVYLLVFNISLSVFVFVPMFSIWGSKEIFLVIKKKIYANVDNFLILFYNII